MLSKMSHPKFELLYWPLPFRGCFISYLFAYRDIPLLEISDFDDIRNHKNRHPSEQDIPFMGPPVLRNRESGQALSQMPAIVLYVSRELDFMPDDPFDVAMCMKILMDCNDILMEICRLNGSTMWQREQWVEFRSERLPRWLEILEESLDRGFLGRDRDTFADVGVFALLGNMTRCLPELDADVLGHAPGIHTHCQRIGSKPSVAKYVQDQVERYGTLYCGGQIEQSIRTMLEMDAI